MSRYGYGRGPSAYDADQEYMEAAADTFGTTDKEDLETLVRVSQYEREDPDQ